MDCKRALIQFWHLMDDIDTAGDMFKPHDLPSWEAYYRYVNKKLRERFTLLTSDGYDLFEQHKRPPNVEVRAKRYVFENL